MWRSQYRKKRNYGIGGFLPTLNSYSREDFHDTQSSSSIPSSSDSNDDNAILSPGLITRYNTEDRKKLSYRQSRHKQRRRYCSIIDCENSNTIVPTIYCEEENAAFDADVDDDSDSAPSEKLTAGTSMTSKTSLMSVYSYEKDILTSKIATPPRVAFIPSSSSPTVSSPLSSSYYSHSSSSTTNIPKNSSDTKFRYRDTELNSSIKIPQTLRLRPRSNIKWNNADSKSVNMHQLEPIPLFDVRGLNHQNNNFVSNKRTWSVSHMSRKRAFLLSVAFFVYFSAFTIILINIKFLRYPIVSDEVARLKLFQIYVGETSKVDGSSFIFDYESESILKRKAHQHSVEYTIKRTPGGLLPIYDGKQEMKTFKNNIDGQRHRGLWYLDSIIHNTAHSHGRKGLHYPRILSFHSIVHRVKELELYPTTFSDSTQLYGVLDSGDPELSQMEPIIDELDKECTPIDEWQSKYYPSCNGMHELDLVSLKEVKMVGKKGYWRNAWKIDLGPDSTGSMETMILKTPKFDLNFEQAYYEHDRIDAQAMEHLTFSPFVIDIYSFCGRSVLTEFGEGPRLGTIFDKAKKQPLKRLKIARDIAAGLSHVHYGKDGDIPSFVHLDINPANIVVTNNALKLNDFNIGIMLKRNITSGLQCAFPAHQFPNPQWRSPEEVNEQSDLSEKVDVYSLGNIFFRMICGHEPWNKLEINGKPSSTMLREKVKAGTLPHIPDHIMTTTDSEERVILDAMLASYTLDPKERPSSLRISQFLDLELKNLLHGGNYRGMKNT